MTDSEAFTRLWTQAQPAVSAFIASLIPDFREAEDILQDVAVVLLRKFGEYRSDKPFAAWAMGVARFEVLQSRRSYARSFVTYRAELVDRVADACEEMAPELPSRARALRDCLQAVEPRGMRLVRMKYEESLPADEIARREGMQAGAVRVALSRIRAALEECVERKGPHA